MSFYVFVGFEFDPDGQGVPLENVSMTPGGPQRVVLLPLEFV